MPAERPKAQAEGLKLPGSLVKLESALPFTYAYPEASWAMNPEDPQTDNAR